MQEYIMDAIVLRKEPQGDLDGWYSFFTERFGKITGRAKSSRKITSKLASHLEPGMFTKVRFMESHGTQIIDALKSDVMNISLINLHFLSQLLPESQPEPELWELLFTPHDRFDWIKILTILGWDPEEAVCSACAKERPEYFYIPRQEFFCARDVQKLPLKLRRNAVLSLYGV